MDQHQLLLVFTIAGFLISCGAGITSQIWKSSNDVPGQIRKRLTPAGWLSLGIALVGLLGSIGSALLGVSLKNNERLQAKTEAAQTKALQDQEARWRRDMSTLLQETKGDIEKNIGNTIEGFQDSQNRFNLTQTEITASKQSVLESNLQHTNEIIVAGQPLTSLVFDWQFESKSSKLWQLMKDGDEEIDENNESVQGGIPRVPYEAMEYEAALLPLVSFVARIGQKPDEERDSREFGKTVIVLVSLDESQNAILSFGQVLPDVSWYQEEGDPPLSAGFLGTMGFQVGNSSPSVINHLAANPRRGTSSYWVNWDIDAGTLPRSIDRKNPDIMPTAKLPQSLKMAIFYDVKMLPFRRNNFAVPYALNLWRNNGNTRQGIPLGSDLRNAMLTLEVNRVRQTKFLLKKMYRLELLDEFSDYFDTACTVLEFEAS